MADAASRRTRRSTVAKAAAGRLPDALRHLSCTASAHRRLWQLAAVARLLTRLAQDAGSFDAVFERHGFLRLYGDELLGIGLAGVQAAQASATLCRHLHQWQTGCSRHLPLLALSAAYALDDDGLLLLLTAALPDEDARFGALFEQLNGQPGARRPTAGLVATWWEADERGPLLASRLLSAGLLRTPDLQAPRADWPLQVPATLWQALRGADQPGDMVLPAWLRWQPASQARPFSQLVLDDALRLSAATALALLREGDAPALVLRSPPGNGRRTLLAALAAEAGFGIAEATHLPETAEAWNEWAAVCVALHAWPLLVLQTAPGQTLTLRRWPAAAGALLVALERAGGVNGEGAAGALHLELPLPGPGERERQWLDALPDSRLFGADTRHDLALRFRIGRGQIHRVARQLAGQRRLDRPPPPAADAPLPWHQTVAAALLPEQRRALETVAVLLPPAPSWPALVLPEATLAELKGLELRCRWRERLQEAARPADADSTLPGGLLVDAPRGVRALFSGASGTGKTLAARVLATALGKPLFRLDLSAIVDKYIGETEKNLERALSRAEEQDVVLLLDEGDALLTRRTAVGNATDRYANLETNYLLQRLESFEGILVITSNAAERIDSAFARRIDVDIVFPPPGAEQRLAIWQRHLPQRHGVDEAQLWALAWRCELSGGQIRNAALHARLAAEQAQGLIDHARLVGAVRREYTKAGGVCPLAQG